MAIRRNGWLGLLCALSSSTFGADTPDAEAPATDAPADAATPAFLITGYLDAAYSYLSGDGRFTGGTPDRVFDTLHDGVELHQAAVNVAYQPKEGFGGVINPTIGDDADVIRAYNGAVSTPKADLTQAFAQYATHGFTIMAGKFVTLAGSEVIPPTADTNVSRSILFGFAVPFTHTGIRTLYAPNDLLTAYLGVDNGWDDVEATTAAKTLEIGLGVTPSKALNLAAYGYFGKARAGGLVDTGPTGQRSLIDLQATWNVSESLSLVANYDWGRQDNAAPFAGPHVDAVWSGIAGYANYTLSEHWKTSLRLECFDDPDGYRTGVAQTWHETTGTVAFLPDKRLEVRAEVRLDGSNGRAFQNVNGVPVQNQQSAALEALFKYP
jgi:hypothetical protein